MIDYKQNTVWINYILNRNIANKITSHDVFLFELMSRLYTVNYTNSYMNLAVILCILPKNSVQEKERLIAGKKTKKLEIRINADYDRLLQADERETLQIIAETYLKAIEIFLIPRKDFEGKKFYEDVKNLFEKEGILKKIE